MNRISLYTRVTTFRCFFSFNFTQSASEPWDVKHSSQYHSITNTSFSCLALGYTTWSMSLEFSVFLNERDVSNKWHQDSMVYMWCVYIIPSMGSIFVEKTFFAGTKKRKRKNFVPHGACYLINLSPSFSRVHLHSIFPLNCYRNELKTWYDFRLRQNTEISACISTTTIREITMTAITYICNNFI